MRLDYVLYAVGVVLLIITVVPFIAPIGVETTETSIWVVASVVLGLFSIGMGYTQRPKTEAQACQPAAPVTQEAMPQTQTATMTEAPKEETEATVEKAAMKEPQMVTAPAAAATVELTQVKGVGEKRAMQLKALGINNVDELSRASAKTLAKKLKVSPKTVNKWIADAKKLVE
jgi:predicted flap endonuclease-1-like 5' DNA nuclease